MAFILMVIMLVLMGFSLGMLYNTFRVGKALKKNRIILREIDNSFNVLEEEVEKLDASNLSKEELDKIENQRKELIFKFYHLSGRLEASEELIN